jgi:hypothetical protein
MVDVKFDRKSWKRSYQNDYHCNDTIGMISFVDLQSAFELADDNKDGMITFEEAMEAVESAFSCTPFHGAEMVRETLLLLADDKEAKSGRVGSASEIKGKGYPCWRIYGYCRWICALVPCAAHVVEKICSSSWPGRPITQRDSAARKLCQGKRRGN